MDCEGRPGSRDRTSGHRDADGDCRVARVRPTTTLRSPWMRHRGRPDNHRGPTQPAAMPIIYIMSYQLDGVDHRSGCGIARRSSPSIPAKSTGLQV